MNKFLMEEKALKEQGFEGKGGITCDGDPWTVHSACPDCKMIRYSNGCVVTDCDCDDEYDANDDSLAAAAPEMLDLLKRCLPWMSKMKVDQGHCGTVAPSAFERVYRDMTDFLNRMNKKEVDHDNH